jgi:hypothetical protein
MATNEEWTDQQKAEFIRAVLSIESVASEYILFYGDAQASMVRLPEHLNPAYYDLRLNNAMDRIKEILNKEKETK